MKDGERRFFPFRWGLGDLLVLLSFGILLYLSFHPLELGIAAAKKELEATQSLETWINSLNRKDLHEAFGGFVDSLLEDRRYQLIEKEETGIPLPFIPVLQDLDFHYGLSLPALGKGVGALWCAKERTGNKLWISSARELKGLDPRRPLIRLKRLSSLLRVSRFGKAFPAYWKEIVNDPDLQAFPSGILKQKTYFFLHALLQEEGRLGLGIYAWPERRGREGFAAFFYHPGSGSRQTRNMVHPYEGLHSFPLPRAGLRRPSSKADHKGEYTGLDGNTWFPIEFTR